MKKLLLALLCLQGCAFAAMSTNTVELPAWPILLERFDKIDMLDFAYCTDFIKKLAGLTHKNAYNIAEIVEEESKIYFKNMISGKIDRDILYFARLQILKAKIKQKKRLMLVVLLQDTPAALKEFEAIHITYPLS